MKTKGNTVLVTGGASGIGLALARAFHNEHSTAIIVGRDKKKLSEAKRKCPDLHVIQADITKESDRQRLAKDVQNRFPDLNLLINNAGIAFFSDLQHDTDSYEKLCLEIETNYLAPVRLTSLFLNLLRQQPSAAVINITTIGAYLPLTIMPGYSASKAALHSITRSLRRQLAGTPIKVFEILPPPVDTKMVLAFHMHKMSPEQLAAEVLQGLRKDRYEMPIGSAKILRWMARIAPHLVESVFHKQVMKAVRTSKVPTN